MAPTPVWLDCDPGHDDAFAIMLAGHAADNAIALLGISATHGNQSVEKTAENVLRTLALSGLTNVCEVAVGQARPLLREPLLCPEIHGDSGLDVQSAHIGGACINQEEEDAMKSFSVAVTQTLNPTKGVLLMEETIRKHRKATGQLVTLVATGCLTNVALLLTLFPEIQHDIEQVVVLGGSEGIGNITPAAEFNILVDPEAARMVFERGAHGLRIVMIPIDVTHTCLVTPEVLSRIEQLDSSFGRVCVDLLCFFRETYRRVFSFEHPPLHDPLAVLFVIAPELFETQRLRVDVETQSPLCYGRTVVDIFSHSTLPRNVTVVKKVDVGSFWNYMLSALHRANAVSPLNAVKTGELAE